MIAQCSVHLAKPLRIQGNIIETYLPGTRIGEVCEIHKSLLESEILGFAQVIGFNNERVILSLLTDNFGFSPDNAILPTGKSLQVNVGPSLAGSILDATGIVRARLDGNTVHPNSGWENILINGVPRDFIDRIPISEPLFTGVKAIDALLTCGRGQRMGIFASAGCGKSTLMNMIVENAEADIYVIALIGERGREVTEMIEELRRSSRNSQIILVYATSDLSSMERCNAAQIATTIAEYFCEHGRNVILFFDSITRYARALRDVALSSGELPARRGYPASVFETLPKLLERPGNFKTGSITAFYTILIESEDEADVIGDEVRSILDGHIYLSRKLAAKGHYPAIDVLQSVSRLFPQITALHHKKAAAQFRDLLVRQQDMQLYLDLGEYQRGENVLNDEAFDKKPNMVKFLIQGIDEIADIASTLEKLYECV